MNFLYKIFFIVLFGINFVSKACSPLNVPTLLSQSISSNSLVLNWQTNGTYTCTNEIDVEIACFANAFTGSPFATFTTSPFQATVIPQAYPTQYISLLNFCPGVYKFRVRERNSGFGPGNASPWSAPYTFTIPGGFNPPSSSIQSSNLNICPPQSTTLTAIVNVDCGIPPFSYSWAPSAGMSCATCSATVVSPTVTTTYTVWINGGQLSCWTTSATITIYIGPIPPVIGPANAFPSTVCSGSTTIVGLAFYNGNIQWQYSANSSGPWSNVPGGNGYNFVTNTMTNTIHYRALVQGCMTVDSSNVVSVLVNPNPTVTISDVLICPGQTATLTASGASSYQWSAGSFPTGINTGGAAPGSTTVYTVTGVTSNCTGTALVTVSVGLTPLVAVNDQTVCFNQNLNLVAGGGGTYAWQGPMGFNSSQQNPVIPNANTSMSGNYSVTVTSSVGCTNSGISNITVLPIITPTILSNNPVCNGGSLTYTALGANQYTWTGPNGWTTNNPNPVLTNISYAEGGVYTLIGGIGACTGTATNFVIVLSPPNPSAQNSSPVCDGFPVSFTALGGVTYTWSGPSGFVSTNQHPTIPNMYLNNAGPYTLSATGSNSCIAKVVTNVVVNPLPAIPVNNLTVCLNSPINLISGGGVSYSWKGPNNFTSNFQNPVIPNANFPLSGQYSVSVVSAQNCSNNAVTSVIVIGIPSPSITSASTICAGGTLSLQGSGGNTYAWIGPNGFTSTQQNTVIPNISVASSGIYSLSAISGFCTGVITRSITVLPLPVLTIGTTTTCETRNLPLVITGGVSYQWYSPGGIYSPLPTFVLPYAQFSDAGTYTAVVTGSNSCQTTTTFPVAVLPNPIVAATGATVCAGQPALITSNGGLSYNWTGPGFSSNLANATIPNVNSNTYGTYYITVTAVNSCTTMVPVDVALIPLPTPTIIVTPTVCYNSEISLQATGGISYQWNGPFDFVSLKQNTTFTASSMGLSGTYTLAAFNSSGCVGYATALVTVYPIPEGLLISDNNLHCVPFCSEFGFANKNSIPVLSTSWQINGQKYVADKFRYCFFQPGKYTVIGDFGDANGCVNTAAFMVVADESPIADFQYTPENPIETADEVMFRNLSTGNNISKFSWSFVNNSGYKTSAENPSFYFKDAGAYPVSLVVKNQHGCADTMVKSVLVDEDFIFYVPTAFTPNEDDRNEVFQPKGRGVVTYNLMIHDRWGEKVFETTNFDEGWDGTFRGKQCKSEIYQWHIVAANKNGKTKDLWGHVTLYR